MIVINLIQNAALLIALAATYQVIMARFQRHDPKSQILFGLLFGGVGIVGMVTPVHLTPGIFFDGRSIILSVAGLFGGPVVAAIAAPICGAYRWWLGGSGALMGILIIAESALIGVLAFFWRRKTGKSKMGILQLWGFGLMVHVIVLVLMPATMGQTGFGVLKLVGLPVIALYPLATVLICLLFQDYEKQALDREKLIESESLYRNLVDHLPQRIFIKDRNSVYLSCNANYANDHGTTTEQIVGMNDFALYPKELAEKHVIDDHEVIDTGNVKDIEEIYMENDQDKWIRTIKIPYHDHNGQIIGIMGISTDITDRKRTEEELRISEEKYRSVFMNAPIGIFRSTVDGKLVDVNPAYARIFGYDSPEEMISFVNRTSIAKSLFIKPSLRSTIIDKVLAFNHEWLETEVQYRRKDNKASLTRVMIRKIPGQIGLMEGFIEDISKRKRLEEVQHRLSTVVEQAAEGILIADTTGVIQYVNPSLESISGYGKAELIGARTSIFKSDEYDPEFARNLWNTINNGKVWTGRFTNRKKDGTIYYVEATISPVRGSNGKIINFVAVERDVTEHLQLSKQLLQAQKMEAVGTLAGGIAHDFNNLLQVVLGYSEMLLREDGEEWKHTHASQIEQIYQAGKRGADLVRSLMTFSRKTETKPIPVNLNDEVRRLTGMLARTIPKMIEIETLLNSDLITIEADPTQIDQVLINLAINAKDAMNDHGKLSIQTSNVVLDDVYCGSHVGVKPGAYVLLAVSDTGAGMEKETLGHIFEPFFTTKEKGKGTGLGLSTVYGIVKQHNGSIDCESGPGIGTTFKVYFPAIRAAKEELEASADESIPEQGYETILIVDDEESIINVACQMFRKRGYRVLKASDVTEALNSFRRESDNISLVILDIMMPKMSGHACLEELLKIDPGVKVLVATGLSPNSEQVSTAINSGAKAAIHKPYDMNELLHVVRDILDKE
ncbi:MAG: PAS domain S-box protein [Deltaproteobacteria bacterium]|nr:PAS domain S-box protein [Deltaproteobacteria bacterium]